MVKASVIMEPEPIWAFKSICIPMSKHITKPTFIRIRKAGILSLLRSNPGYKFFLNANVFFIELSLNVSIKN